MAHPAVGSPPAPSGEDDCCRQAGDYEALPEQIPARARITTMARRAAAEWIGDHLRPVSGVAAEMGMDWRIAHAAFVAADEVPPDGAPPVRVLGIDETRRRKGRYQVESSTGVRVWVDRFDTGLVDLDAKLLGVIELMKIIVDSAMKAVPGIAEWRWDKRYANLGADLKDFYVDGKRAVAGGAEVIFGAGATTSAV